MAELSTLSSKMDIITIMNGDLQSMDWSHMIQKFTVYCNEGYIPTHASATGCILDGDWNIPIATCTGN